VFTPEPETQRYAFIATGTFARSFNGSVNPLYRRSPVPGTRRVLLKGTRYHVYYVPRRRRTGAFRVAWAGWRGTASSCVIGGSREHEAAMFRPTTVDAATPRAVRAFVSQVMDVYLADIHAMLRLPRPEVNIVEGCNFSIVAVLMNIISGVSVVLYEPPANRQATARKFIETAKGFYPWDTEPVAAIDNPGEGAEILYGSFRNPMAHALGFQEPEPPGPLSVTRFPGPGLAEADLETIETSIGRPNQALRGAPTLMRDSATRALSLNVESFYWGVRELLRRLTADAARVALAEKYLGSMLRTTR
jgi:hypothetical protein